MDTGALVALAERVLAPTYRRPPIVFTHGEGVYVYDAAGRRYLDFVAGIAVCALGHADPGVAQVIAEQARRLIHVSNLYHTEPHLRLAEALVAHSFADRVFFCNSGAEAVEAALKFARKFARTHYDDRKIGFVAFTHSFHGRTMGALSVTEKPAYREPFAPLIPGVTFAPFNDGEAAGAAITAETCAVIVEPIQGEGGVHIASPEFLRTLRARCDETGALLIFDEVQCGLGRTGTLWAYEAYGVEPDLLTVAKPLANGLPIGAVLMREKVAAVLQPGDHGSTFAGGPLVSAVALHVFQRLRDPTFLAHVRETGAYLMERLHAAELPGVREIRGRGLLVGIEIEGDARAVTMAALERGLLLTTAGDHVVRMVPPLIVERSHIDEAVAILQEAMAAGMG
ncbi:aspartate aminotransferase family protein [Thermoflexus sp.]|uniref:aspartate aminotransferase family protein n=1 Tax=Thermoflexus sp. TaxID=1969742 RepID=UPI001759F497|nr:aspartate aminotransferase family protein [Thermoflexus sp.]